MYNCYIEDTNGSNRIYIEIDPIISPKPEVERDVRVYKSVMSFTYSGTKINPYTHIIDAGVPTGSGIIPVTFKHLSYGIFVQLWNKFTSNPPTEQNFYNYRTNTIYSSVILKNLKFEFIEGVEDSENLLGTEQKVVDGSFELHTPSTPSL